jgi:penicillin-binding protein 1B
VAGVWQRRWVRITAALLALPIVALIGVGAYYYVTYARIIEARLHGERERVFPRVYARPLELRRGQSMTDRQLVDRLNDLGYAERSEPKRPGEFSIADGVVSIRSRKVDAKGRLITVSFQRPVPPPRKGSRRPAPPPKLSDRVERLELGAERRERILLDAPLLTAIVTGERAKRRPVAIAAIPERMTQAVLAIEDRRFYDHPGVDVIRSIGAIVTNLRGDTPYLVGGSTITQQLV